MLDWKEVDKKLPDDGALCLLLGESGLIQGPITWNKEAKVWLDLFGPLASQEAGVSIPPDSKGLLYWAECNMPEGF